MDAKEHIAKDEYDLLTESLKHYENLIFANLTVFVTVTAGILGLIFGAKPPPEFLVCAQFGGVLTVLVFGVNTYSYLRRWSKFFDRATELETKLSYQHWKLVQPPNCRWFQRWNWLRNWTSPIWYTSFILWGLFYSAFLLFWCFAQKFVQ